MKIIELTLEGSKRLLVRADCILYMYTWVQTYVSETGDDSCFRTLYGVKMVNGDEFVFLDEASSTKAYTDWSSWAMSESLLTRLRY